jgi:hypothetical protein
MDNPLQAKRSSGYKMTPTLSELRSSSICDHKNHLNHINHSSDKRKKSAKICINLRHLRAYSWIASCLAMTNNCVRNDGQSPSCSSFNPVNPDSDNNNHSNHINHSSDIRKKSAGIFLNLRHLRAFFWIASCLAMTNYCIRKDKSNKQQAKTRSLINHIKHRSDIRKKICGHLH